MELATGKFEESEDTKENAVQVQDEIRKKVKNWNGAGEIIKWRKRN